MRTHCLLCVIAVLGSSVTLPAQQPVTPRTAAQAATDMSDITFLRVFYDLHITRQQATLIARDLATLQSALQGNSDWLDRQRRAAAATMPDLRETLLRGGTPDDNQAPLADRLAQLDTAAASQRQAALDVAYQRVLNRLTPQQLALLGYEGSAAGAPRDALPDTSSDTAAQLQQNTLAYGNLFRHARNTPMPDRFRRFAPGEVARVTSAATALPAGHPALNSLNQLVLTRLRQVYRLPPLEYRQFSPDIAWQLAVASQEVRQQTDAASPERRAANAAVAPERLRQVLPYERGPALLGELVRRWQAER